MDKGSGRDVSGKALGEHKGLHYQPALYGKTDNHKAGAGDQPALPQAQRRYVDNDG